MKTKTYRVLVESGEDGWLVAEVPELRGCFTQGKDMAELNYMIKDAIEGYLIAFEHQKKPKFEIKIEQSETALA